MLHRHVWLATVATLLLALTGIAQEGEREVAPSQARRPDRPRMGLRRNVLVDRLTRELTLTPDQRDQVQQIVERYQEQIRSSGEQAEKLRERSKKKVELMRDRDDARREGDEQKVEALQQQLDQLRKENPMLKMHQLALDLRRADREGDQEKVETLQKELDGLRKEDPMLRMRQAMLDQIEGLLDDEQKVKFREVKDDLMGPTGSVAPDLTNPTVLRFALLETLTLEDAQRDQIRELFREHRDKARELRGATFDERAALNKKLYEDVLAQLTPEQREQLKRWRPHARPRIALQNPRVLRRMLDRVELREDQQTEVDALFERFENDRRNLDRDDRQGRRQLGEKLLQDVTKLLDDDQKKQLEAMGPRPGMGAWGRGMRGPRGRVAAPPAVTESETEAEAEVEMESEPVESD